LGRNRESIESGDCRVLFVDECHLLSGDIQGYVWGRRGEGVEVPLVNERERQTYYGALDLKSKQVFLEAHRQGDTQSTLVQRGRNEGSIEGMLKRSYESCLVYPLPP